MALLSYIDYTLNGATITGVGWTAGLPVTNLAPYDLGQPTRSTALDTTISVDLGTEKTLGIVGIPKHNLSYQATWRIRASNNVLLLTAPVLVPLAEVIYDSSSTSSTPETTSTTTIDVLSPPSTIYVQENLYFSVGRSIEIRDGNNYLIATVTSYDNLTKALGISVTDNSAAAYTGNSWVISTAADLGNIWPVSAGFGSTEWGQFPWDGQLDIVSDSQSRPPALNILPEDISARYIYIELQDSSNVNAYLDLNKLIIGPTWRTSVDISKGYSIAYEDKSKVVRSRGGQAYVNILPQYRKFTVKFDGMPRSELHTNMLEVDRLISTGSPLLLCLDPGDLSNLGNKSVYGSQAKLTKASERHTDFMSKQLIIEEWI